LPEGRKDSILITEAKIDHVPVPTHPDEIQEMEHGGKQGSLWTPEVRRGGIKGDPSPISEIDLYPTVGVALPVKFTQSLLPSGQRTLILLALEKTS